MMSVEQMNDDFGIDGQLRFVEGPGGLTMIEIDNVQARATISTYAGQVLSFKPQGAAQDLLFVSKKAYFAEGKAIKGGIPICWPWFGPDPEDRGRPAHGFVRSWPWHVLATEALPDGTTRVKLGVADDADTRSIWTQTFNLLLQISVGPTLRLELITRNAGDMSFPITQGFHTYFKVGDIDRVKVLGLEDHSFTDKTAWDAEETQIGPVTIAGEVNRIYRGVKRDLIIDDGALDRRIRIRGTASSTCVVWNPWIETAVSMADLEDDDFKRMLCVETVNAGDETVWVPPRDDVRIGVEYGEDM
jgi:glucose-6-phosphate 1-epimerase